MNTKKYSQPVAVRNNEDETQKLVQYLDKLFENRNTNLEKERKNILQEVLSITKGKPLLIENARVK